MSSNESTIKGKFDEVAGKTKEAFGNATGNQATANSGAAQQVKGDAEQSWGSVKDAAHDATRDSATTQRSTTDANAQGTRDTVTSAAANLKNRVENAFTPEK